jgi:hypothetical protein
MCGGLVLATCKTGPQILRYHAGRGLAYAALGAASGWAGKVLLGSVLLRWIPFLASLLFACAIVAVGIAIALGTTPHWNVVPRKWLMSGMRAFGTRPLALGALSALLPCGWLHTFTLGAAATQSALAGAAFMGIFWLGTVPALSGAPWLIRKGLRPLGIQAPRLAAAVLVIAALSGLGLHLAGSSTEGQASCPMHAQ